MLQVKDIQENIIFIPSMRAKNNKDEHITIHQDLEALIQEHTAYSNTPRTTAFSWMTKSRRKCRLG